MRRSNQNIGSWILWTFKKLIIRFDFALHPSQQLHRWVCLFCSVQVYSTKQLLTFKLSNQVWFFDWSTNWDSQCYWNYFRFLSHLIFVLRFLGMHRRVGFVTAGSTQILKRFGICENTRAITNPPPPSRPGNDRLSSVVCSFFVFC